MSSICFFSLSLALPAALEPKAEPLQAAGEAPCTQSRLSLCRLLSARLPIFYCLSGFCAIWGKHRGLGCVIVGHHPPFPLPVPSQQLNSSLAYAQEDTLDGHRVPWFYGTPPVEIFSALFGIDNFCFIAHIKINAKR